MTDPKTQAAVNAALNTYHEAIDKGYPAHAAMDGAIRSALASQAERIKELEAKLGAVLAATTQDTAGRWIFDHADPEWLLTDAAAVLPDDAGPPAAPYLPADVVELVIAAREAWEIAEGYGLEDEERNAFECLDKALEAFSARVPYENEPEDAALAPFADRVAGEEEPDDYAVVDDRIRPSREAAIDAAIEATAPAVAEQTEGEG